MAGVLYASGNDCYVVDVHRQWGSFADDKLDMRVLIVKVQHFAGDQREVAPFLHANLAAQADSGARRQPIWPRANVLRGACHACAQSYIRSVVFTCSHSCETDGLSFWNSFDESTMPPLALAVS